MNNLDILFKCDPIESPIVKEKTKNYLIYFIEGKIKGFEEIFNTFTDDMLNSKLEEHGFNPDIFNNRDKAIYTLALSYLSQDEIEIYIKRV